MNLLKLIDFLLPKQANLIKLDVEAVEEYTKEVEAFYASINEKMPDRFRAEMRVAFYKGRQSERNRK